MKSKPKPPPACPLCNKSDMVIPIVYGLPIKELFDESEKGLVRLGGCVIESPQWYCKRDDKEF